MTHRKLPLPLLGIPLLLTVPLSGCLDLDGISPAGLGAGSLVVDTGGSPVPFAAVTALAAGGGPLATLSTTAQGVLPHALVPTGADDILVTGPGLGTWKGSANRLPERIPLPALPDGGIQPDDLTPALRFLDPVRLGGAYLGDTELTCDAANCGGSEPSVEVAADGTIYATAVCCVGKSPPVWASRDGGATFIPLEGDALRESFGIEGDFAVDDAGNLYFSDISLASAYFSSWDKDGNHRWTVPAGPFPPPVDRPWVRAGAEDEVFFAYNTGFTTRFHKSTDGGRTWDPGREFAGNLGALGQGPERGHLYLTARGTLYESPDAGATWSEGESYPFPSSEGNTFQAYEVPVADEAGNLWIVYDWREQKSDDDSEPYHVHAVRRDAGGNWHGPYQVSPQEGTHHLPWPATGRDGNLVVAWYGTVDDAKGPNSVDEDSLWHVYAAVTLDATSTNPVFQVVRADAEPVHAGPINRKLLDFLQVDVGPGGAVHLVYAEDREGRKDETTHYVRSTIGLQLQPEVYPNGPKTG